MNLAQKTGCAPRVAVKTPTLCATSEGASPTQAPRFRLSQGGLDTPPWRVVHRARTCAGTGQSGRKKQSAAKACGALGAGENCMG